MKRKDICAPISGTIYLSRWHLARLFGCALILHKMHRSDYSSCDHDHPWWFVSLVLAAAHGKSLAAFVRELTLEAAADKLQPNEAAE